MRVHDIFAEIYVCMQNLCNRISPVMNQPLDENCIRIFSFSFFASSLGKTKRVFHANRIGKSNEKGYENCMHMSPSKLTLVERCVCFRTVWIMMQQLFEWSHGTKKDD